MTKTKGTTGITRDRQHSWISWEGYSKGAKAKCTRCEVIRRQTGRGKGVEYSKRGKILPERPDCETIDWNAL